MRLSELEALTYVFSKDVTRKRDQGFIQLLLNTAAQEFNKSTGVFRSRAQVTVLNGVAVLNAIPDSLNLFGRILRVEDANNGNKALTQTNETVLDVLPGPQWRQDQQAPIRSWYRGTPNTGTQDGFGAIGVYPCVASGTLNVYYVDTPRKLTTDVNVSDIPEQFQIAQVWWAVKSILAAEGDPSMQAQLAFASSQWDAEVARANGDVASWMTTMGK